jgi:large subunit ribosomal protein L10
MDRSVKAAEIADIQATWDKASSVVLVDYRGMTVEAINNLRAQFREKGVRYKVFKNTLVMKALENTDMAGKVSGVLKGMTGVAWSFEEPSAAARIIKEFRKDNEKLVIKAGIMDGQVFGAQAVEDQLAALPSKDEARAQLLATLMAPAQNFVRLLNAPAQNFVGVLAAKQRQMEEG